MLTQRNILESLAWLACAVLAAAAGAKAAAPVETSGWEGAKEALTQAQQAAAAPEPPQARPAATRQVCYRATTLDTADGPVGALALHLWVPGDHAPRPIDNAVGLTVSDALHALGEESVLADVDPSDVVACPPPGAPPDPPEHP